MAGWTTNCPQTTLQQDTSSIVMLCYCMLCSTPFQTPSSPFLSGLPTLYNLIHCSQTNSRDICDAQYLTTCDWLDHQLPTNNSPYETGMLCNTTLQTPNIPVLSGLPTLFNLIHCCQTTSVHICDAQYLTTCG